MDAAKAWNDVDGREWTHLDKMVPSLDYVGESDMFAICYRVMKKPLEMANNVCSRKTGFTPTVLQCVPSLPNTGNLTIDRATKITLHASRRPPARTHVRDAWICYQQVASCTCWSAAQHSVSIAGDTSK
jgi:hypothetical protein